MATLPTKPGSGTNWDAYGTALDAIIRDLQLAGYGTGASVLGWVAVDSFPGSTDSAKLANAMAYASQQTQKPVLRLSNKRYTFDQSLGIPYDGFSIRGSGFGQLDVYSSTRAANHTTVELAIPGSGLQYWINNPANPVTTSWGGYVGGINFLTTGYANQVFMRMDYPSQARIWTVEDVSFQGLYGVFGADNTQLSGTINNFVGSWYIANCRGPGVGFRGSDCIAVWPYGIDFYQSGVYGDGGEKFAVNLNSLGKSNLSRMYITAFGGWRPLKIIGSSNNGRVVIDKSIIEGDKNTAASSCNGAMVKIGDGSSSGGLVTLRDLTVNSGMANPSKTAAANSSGQADRALIDITGPDTNVFIDGIDFAHGTGIDPATMPCIRVSNGAKVTIRNLRKFQRDGGGAAWGSNMPRVEQSAPGLITDWDNTVAVDPSTGAPFVVA